MLVLFYACLLLYASAPLRFYAYTPLQLYASNGARTLNQSLSNLLIIFPTLLLVFIIINIIVIVIIIVIGIGIDVGIVIVIAIVIVIIIIIIIIIIKSYIYCSFKGPRVFTTLSAEKVEHQAI